MSINVFWFFTCRKLTLHNAPEDIIPMIKYDCAVGKVPKKMTERQGKNVEKPNRLKVAAIGQDVERLKIYKYFDKAEIT